MILKITNDALDYAWGSKTLIPDYFGTEATGGPMAEIWLGTHPSNPSKLVDEAGTDLLAKLGHQLTFLLKVLAADRPLSLQAHPNSKQAAAGFSRENKAGVALTAAARNYKDDKHKPEMIVALMPGFEALVGFRPLAQVNEILSELASQPGELGEYAAEWLAQADDLKKLFSSMLMLGTRARPLIQQLVQVEAVAESTRDAIAVAAEVAQDFGADPGVFVTLLMNHVTLKAAEALAVPAGQLHAYLRGIGVEVMAESDNVLRGGLTKKHIDLRELEQVLVFESVVPELVATESLAKGLTLYKSDFDDFLLYRIDLNGSTVLADLNLPGEGILLCTSGQLVVSNSLGETATLRRSEAAYLANDARLFTLSSSGTGYFVTASK
ncbi:MAG: hypothetical protein RL670_1232 [Actinomycetota bacterium]|jgi:mannose-6-phosphate isomerase